MPPKHLPIFYETPFRKKMLEIRTNLKKKRVFMMLEGNEDERDNVNDNGG